MGWQTSRIVRGALGLAAVAVAATVSMGFTNPGPRMSIWDLKLGSTVAEMPPLIAFKGYACGSNGGPPLKKLNGWADFAQCAPEADGLHEVYFEYDDEGEYIARALEDITLSRDIGTVDKSFPIVASALFNDAGVLQGLRLMTDPREDARKDNEWADIKARVDHYSLAPFLAGQFGINQQTDCKDEPKGENENAIGGIFIKQICERVDTAQNRRYIVEQHYLRKPGQSARDPNTGMMTNGQYESFTRAGIYLADGPYAPEG